MKRFTLTVSQKSAEGTVDPAVGKAREALQDRKVEQRIGRAGNGDRKALNLGYAADFGRWCGSNGSADARDSKHFANGV